LRHQKIAASKNCGGFNYFYGIKKIRRQKIAADLIIFTASKKYGAKKLRRI
jgi:hypothetical protein